MENNSRAAALDSGHRHRHLSLSRPPPVSIRTISTTTRGIITAQVYEFTRTNNTVSAWVYMDRVPAGKKWRVMAVDAMNITGTHTFSVLLMVDAMTGSEIRLKTQATADPLEWQPPSEFWVYQGSFFGVYVDWTVNGNVRLRVYVEESDL